MKSMHLKLTSLAALGSFALSGFAAAARPNIVLIMTDDQGYGDVGIHGNPVLETPHLDALVRSGAALPHFYTSTVCSPTRASVMTGRYSYRTRVVDTFRGRSMMDPGETTLPEALRAAGYTTGIFGKWHLGDNYPLRPTDRGFEEALIHRGGGLAQPSDPIENRRRYTDPILFRNNRLVQAKGYCTDVFFDGALDFIAGAHRASRPFFAYIALNAPHNPLHDVPPALYEKYKSMDLSAVLTTPGNSAEEVARIYAMVENIDENVGRLMARLREERLLENTIIIFMGDNGPAGDRFTSGLRGSKGQHYEGGIRAPFFVRWDGRIAPGAAPKAITAHIDVMPTLLEAAGITPPASVHFDGRSLLPLLENRATPWPNRTLVFQYHRGERPIEWHNVAVRTQRWKLVRPSGRGDHPVDAPIELYDLEKDPGERRDLAAAHPEVVAQLREVYRKWFMDVSSTRPDNYAPPRIVIGSDQQTETALTQQDWREVVSASQGQSPLGIWLLRAERDATYALELRWPQPVAPGMIEIKVGSEKRTVRIDQATDRVRVEDLRIPKGDLDFSAMVRRERSLDGAYHATLTRR